MLTGRAFSLEGACLGLQTELMCSANMFLCWAPPAPASLDKTAQTHRQGLQVPAVS